MFTRSMQRTHRVITCNRRSHFPPRQMASITRTGCSLSVTVSSRIDRSGVWALQAIRPGEAVREGVGGYRNNARHHTPSHPPPPLPRIKLQKRRLASDQYMSSWSIFIQCLTCSTVNNFTLPFFLPNLIRLNNLSQRDARHQESHNHGASWNRIAWLVAHWGLPVAVRCDSMNAIRCRVWRSKRVCEYRLLIGGRAWWPRNPDRSLSHRPLLRLVEWLTGVRYPAMSHSLPTSPFHPVLLPWQPPLQHSDSFITMETYQIYSDFHFQPNIENVEKEKHGGKNDSKEYLIVPKNR